MLLCVPHHSYGTRATHWIIWYQLFPVVYQFVRSLFNVSRLSAPLIYTLFILDYSITWSFWCGLINLSHSQIERSIFFWFKYFYGKKFHFRFSSLEFFVQYLKRFVDLNFVWESKFSLLLSVFISLFFRIAAFYGKRTLNCRLNAWVCHLAIAYQFEITFKMFMMMLWFLKHAME